MQDQPTPPATPQDDPLAMQAVARSYQWTLWLVPLQYLCILASGGFVGGLVRPLVGFVVYAIGSSTPGLARLGFYACGIALAIQGYRFAQRLGRSSPWGWAVAMLLPCVNVLALVHLSELLGAWYRARGSEFSALGPFLHFCAGLRARRAAPSQPQAPPASPEQTATDYIPQARAAGMGDEDIVAALVASGWDETQARGLVAGAPPS